MEKDFVKIYDGAEEYQAVMAVELLEENNIEAVIVNHHDSIFPSLGEAEVYVHKDFEAQAIEILKKMKP
jgi:hypothetical protein